jgi:hypothetical protein
MLGLFDGLVIFAGNGAGEAYCFDAGDRVWRAAWNSSRDDHARPRVVDAALRVPGSRGARYCDRAD